VIVAGTSIVVIVGIARTLWPVVSPPAELVRGIGGGSGAAELARQEPWSVPPLRIKVIPVTPNDVEWLDRQIRPTANVKLSSSQCLHLLRANGLNARYEEGELRSGDALLRLLTEEQSGIAHFGESPLVHTPIGLRFPCLDPHRPSRDRSMEQHRDQTLAAFGELGLPLTYPLKIGEQVRSLREVLRDSIANFHLGQEEIAWTAIAYALYLPPLRSWTNRYDERFTFDELAAELEHRPMDQASCGGIHLLFALTLLVHVDGKAPILSENMRAEIFKHLARCVVVVERTQRPDGTWPACWNHELLPGHRPSGRSLADNDANQLLMTGHLAEWLLYLPENLAHTRSTTIARSGAWLRKRLLVASEAEKEDAFCPYTHGVCVLKRITYLSGEVAPCRSSPEVPAGRSR
jgi:hypothetical protein